MSVCAVREGLYVDAAEWKHIGRRILHNEDVVAAGAVKSWGFESGYGGCFNREARLARGAHNNDVGRWSLKTYRIRRSLSVALRTNRLHT